MDFKGLTTPSLQQIEGTFLIRRMQSSDIPMMAAIAATEYFDSDLNTFLCPHRHQYPDHVTRRFAQMIQGRYLNPRSIGFVAVDPVHPQTPIAYAQFLRLGHDAAARQLLSSQSSFWKTLARWWFQIETSIVNFFWPDKSVDPDAMRRFLESVRRDEFLYWGSPGMAARYGNRWHAGSVVVSSGWQRRGVGGSLMGEVLRRARCEGVVVGLEASGDGERLYQKLGFELRGRFDMMVGPEEGGIMMWTPGKMG